MATIDSEDTAAQLQAELTEVARRAMSGGVNDPDFLSRIRERAERIREEVFQKHGLLDIGTPAIRELRDDADA
jgi:hypothetical protein